MISGEFILLFRGWGYPGKSFLAKAKITLMKMKNGELNIRLYIYFHTKIYSS
jgi:hypothetical protein